MSIIERVIQRGRDADKKLNDSVLNEALEAMLSDVSISWLSTEPSEGAKREELYLRAQAISDLRGKLAEWVANAQFEADKLEKEHRRKK